MEGSLVFRRHFTFHPCPAKRFAPTQAGLTLNFYRGEGIGGIHHKIHFQTGGCAPVTYGSVRIALRHHRPQVLENRCFETGPIDFCRGIQPPPGTNGTKEPGIEKKKLGVLYHPPPGAFQERWETNADEKIYFYT